MPRDLEGLLVVALEQAVAAPYCASRLADAGARVIKLERPEGDFARRYDRHVRGESAYFVWLNRGKESCRVDLKQADDLALVRKLIARADVFIQNLAPGATTRLGLGSAALRDAHPRLITCDISGYGESGPLAHLKAYDLLVQAESGLAELTGSPAEPGRVAVSVCDIACGMYAHQAVLQALFARERSGQGRGIQVSLFHAMADWMNVPYLQHVYGGITPERPGLNHPTIAPYGLYRCGDGQGILLSIQNEREWLAFCEQVLGRPELAGDPRFASGPDRVTNRPALNAAIDSVFSTLSRPEVIERLEAARIAYGRLSTLPDLAAHPQNRYVQVVTSAGDVQLLAPPPVVPGMEEDRLGAVPALGEHDEAVRAEFAGDSQHSR
ncbi:CaiB/BaiF CoA transferase family protein [Aquibaculum arenosum]|uniref:CaiB/BaiF CoA-transferase family protein n=1 Tax=Aquibaculum arenosum TaxID=3032591 RepID=A0ABT5YND9_9PROT|nr:CaiB/BaiF CoA-transferase family protein [Fodinicurvata sp. CAU 1616]MDF2096495.1 CaiB/BaiF CoA-transferase family protein [Fodinicurvata sp. CAU 1616]